MTQKLAPIGQERYAFLLFDSTFKVVLCTPENEKLLIQIIELLIPGKRISGITFINKEMHGLVISEKVVTFDLLCKDAATGEEFLVEVQNAPQRSFQDRVLSYSTYPVREQMAERLRRIREGEKPDRMDYSLKPIYVISLVNFSLNHETEAALEENYICRYELRNKHNAELMTDSLNFVFVEMGRMDLRPEDWKKCNTLLEKFIFSMKYMHMLPERPETFTGDLLEPLYQATELATMSIETRENYDHNMRTELDRIAEIDFAREKGMEKGIEKGMEKGMEKAAMGMLQKGIPVSDVCEITGLSEEVVKSLQQAL